MKAVWLAVLLTGCSSLVPVPEISKVEGTYNPQDAWRKVLAAHVDENGRVDFAGLSKDAGQLKAFVAYVAKEGPRSHSSKFPGREAKLAYYINAYNALSLYAILDSAAPDSLNASRDAKSIRYKKFVVEGEVISLQKLESEVIRPMGEERVHVALNYMTAGSARFPRYPFVAQWLNEELEKQSKFFFNEERNVRVDRTKKIVHVSELLHFFSGDYLSKAKSLIGYVNRYRTEKIPENYRVEFIPFDWKLHSQSRSPAKGFSNAAQTVLEG